MPTPLIAIVGRPNVGKSTLFNKLAGKRLAIVEDTPGVTRDRLYAPVEWCGRTATVIDTGGIVLDEADPLTLQVRRQAEVAMEEADAILFVCDGLEGVTSADRDLADLLRAARAPVFLVVNKSDNSRIAQEATEFYELGLPRFYTISSVHGHGLGDLLDDVMANLPADSDGADDDEIARIAIVGRPNVGKSSLINALLGEERAIVSPIPGTTRDALDTRLTFEGREVVLIDTAGIRRAGKIQGGVEYYTALRAKSAVERCQVAVTVVDGAAGLMDGDKRVMGMAHEAGRAAVVAVNKWDLVDPGIRAGRSPERSRMQQFTREARNELPFLHYASFVFCSAALRFSVVEVVDTALDASIAHAQRIPTPELTRIMRDAVDFRPRMYRGRQLRVYYATMPRVQPPTVLLFVNDPSLLHFSYERYLENRLREAFPLEGTPIVIRARKAENTEKD